MSETPEQAQAGIADALENLSENSRALVRHEIAAAQREMLGQAKQALPALGLLAAAALCGTLSAAASFRLSVQLLEKRLPPAAAAFVAAAGYGAAAGAAAAAGFQRLRALPPLFPAETVRKTAQTVAAAAQHDRARGAGADHR
jgi:hypothetical protein